MHFLNCFVSYTVTVTCQCPAKQPSSNISHTPSHYCLITGKCSSLYQQKQTKTPKTTTTKSVIPPIGVCSDLISLSLWRRPFSQFHTSEWDEIFDWSIFFFTHSESVLHNALLFYIFRLLDLIACAAGPAWDNKLFWLVSPRGSKTALKKTPMLTGIYTVQYHVCYSNFKKASSKRTVF